MFRPFYLLLVFLLSLTACKVIDSPIVPKTVEPVVIEPEVIEPVYTDPPFELSWSFISDYGYIAEEYRTFNGADQYFEPPLRYDRYQDPETFLIPGSEGLLQFHYQDIRAEWRQPGTAELDIPMENRIFYDPEKIELLSEYEEAPPFPLTGWHCFLVSSYTDTISNNPRDERPEPEGQKKDAEFIMETIIKNGRSVMVNRNRASQIRLHYRYLGGGHTYIVLYRCVDRMYFDQADYLAIKITSPDF